MSVPYSRPEKKRKVDSEFLGQQHTATASHFSGSWLGTIDGSPSPSKDAKNTEVVAFRDGEYHRGFASFAEIREGIEDGELSRSAEIFDLAMGCWVSALNVFG